MHILLLVLFGCVLVLLWAALAMARHIQRHSVERKGSTPQSLKADDTTGKVVIMTAKPVEEKAELKSNVKVAGQK